jgi:hypothetical protein
VLFPAKAFADDLRAVAEATGRSIGFVIEYLLRDRIKVLREELQRGGHA